MLQRLGHGSIACVVAAAVLGIGYSQQECDAPVCPSDDPCGLYLAPSTIPNAGLGIFTTKPLKEGDIVGNGDIAIPIVDVDWHRGNRGGFNIFDEYIWQGWAVGMQFESEDEDKGAVSGFLPGMDAAINCNIALVNCDKGMAQYDTYLHRSRDPAAGAITPFHNGSTEVIANVPAGGELFKYYGDDWFENRYDVFGKIPLLFNYDDVDDMFHVISSFSLSEKAERKLWEIIESVPWESRFSNALPKSYKDAVQAKEQGIRSLLQPHAIRPLEWLEKVGRCMDSIRPGESTIKGAGRGAFATRFFAKDSIVTGAPLLHIPDADDFVHMYGYYHDQKGNLQRNTSILVGEQLLVNYCYGHKESTILLCPYGAGVNYINHDSSRANVKIQWTPDGITSQNNEWFEWTVDRMEWNYKISLSLDYVAIRDILPGEELLLDYGPEWEEAWRVHVDNWEAPPESQDYDPAAVWDERLKNQPLRTKLEQEMDPYPYNVRLRCHSLVGYDEGIWPDNWVAEDFGVDCNVVYRTEEEDGETVYEVELPEDEDDDAPTRMRNVPRGAIKFVDQPYTTDIFLPNTFRHEIMIPDDMFPEAWRNRK